MFYSDLTLRVQFGTIESRRILEFRDATDTPQKRKREPQPSVVAELPIVGDS